MTKTFTPPLVTDVPAYLPETGGTARLLWRHYTPRQRGVNVFKLSDGTYVQDTATSENSSTNIPYPWDPDNPSGPYVSGWDPINNVETSTSHAVWIVTAYYGGHSYVVSDTEASALTAAGYGADLH